MESETTPRPTSRTSLRSSWRCSLGSEDFHHDDLGDYKITVVGGETSTIDTARLLDELPQDVIDQITLPTVDSKLLEAAVARGIVSPDLISEVTVTKEKKPHIRVTRKD